MRGKDLKIKRIEKDIKAKDIAKKLEISKSYFSSMENDKVPIPSHLLIEWQKLFNN